MSRIDNYWKRIPLPYGLLLGGLLIAYFLLMVALNLAHIHWLRILNGLILFFVVQAAITKYKSLSKSNFYEDFFDFFKMGMSTGIVGILVFVIFLAVFLDALNPEFMQEVREVQDVTPYLTPMTAAGIVFLEGLASSLIASFIVVQYQKRSTVEKPTDQEEPTEDAQSKAKVDTRK